jgi:hypothetical protein
MAQCWLIGTTPAEPALLSVAVSELLLAVIVISESGNKKYFDLTKNRQTGAFARKHIFNNEGLGLPALQRWVAEGKKICEVLHENCL